jgi:hypothetical protein
MMLECEIRAGARWDIVDISEALSLKDIQMRCVECRGPVCAHKKYSNGTPAHFEHLSTHEGCSQIEATFSGHKFFHPDALK